MAIYDMPSASAQDKTRGWNALSFLEADLVRIGSYLDSEDLNSTVNHGPLGFVQSRAGGLPLRLTYFISPLDKVDVVTKSLRPLTQAMICEENLGISATIGIERSEQSRPMPIHPLISGDGKEIAMSR